ncbi:hypothetical protein [Roseateles sp. LYH14W]|uniref:DUF2281 domain-containing protein n=1 Tax=Pelomonas parva TaxID=3299032 RepID=A0ABW7F0F2_9BURK
MIEARLIAQLKKLPPNRAAGVVAFVDFLAAREERAERRSQQGG